VVILGMSRSWRYLAPSMASQHAIDRLFSASLREKMKGDRLTSVAKAMDQRRSTDVAEITHPGRSSTALRTMAA
jgi:hypothetical protein